MLVDVKETIAAHNKVPAAVEVTRRKSSVARDGGALRDVADVPALAERPAVSRLAIPMPRGRPAYLLSSLCVIAGARLVISTRYL